MVNIKIRLITYFAAEDGEALYSQKKTRLGADCGSDHEVLIAKLRIKLKRVGKSTKPFRYDLNQILYSYTVEVTNRFKGLDLRTVPEELWTHVNRIIQEAAIKSIPQENKIKGKRLSEKALQVADKRKVKGKGNNERDTHLNAEFQKIARNPS